MDEVSIDAHTNHLNIIGVILLITDNSLNESQMCENQCVSVFNQCISSCGCRHFVLTEAIDKQARFRHLSLKLVYECQSVHNV